MCRCEKMVVMFQSLPEEERDRILTEEKLGGARVAGGVASSPHRAKSPSVKVRTSSLLTADNCVMSPNLTSCRPVTLQERSQEAELELWGPAGGPRDRRDGKKTAKLPETPKTAEEMWQHSVIGDYLAKYRVGLDTS